MTEQAKFLYDVFISYCHADQKWVKGWRFPTALQPIADRIRARDIAIFHGALDPKKLNLIEKWMIKNVKAPLGDFRDWNAIAAWASAISDALLRETP